MARKVRRILIAPPVATVLLVRRRECADDRILAARNLVAVPVRAALRDLIWTTATTMVRKVRRISIADLDAMVLPVRREGARRVA
jgi:hypothetical protein